MKNAYRLLLTLGIAAASLSSCSRANYVVNTNAPVSESIDVAVATSDAAASSTAMVNATLPVELTSPAREAASALAHHTSPTQVVEAPKATAVAATETVASPTKSTKAERKALRQQIKRHMAAAPQEKAADGKSQTTALILCILLGGIGVHQFYLGYTGRGILRIALALTAFLIVPAIVNLVLYILDIIKIVNGDLKPRNGEYAKTFNK
jgi:TM2 domain-containing membrane protein YozV